MRLCESFSSKCFFQMCLCFQTDDAIVFKERPSIVCSATLPTSHLPGIMKVSTLGERVGGEDWLWFKSVGQMRSSYLTLSALHNVAVQTRQQESQMKTAEILTSRRKAWWEYEAKGLRSKPLHSNCDGPGKRLALFLCLEGVYHPS